MRNIAHKCGNKVILHTHSGSQNRILHTPLGNNKVSLDIVGWMQKRPISASGSRMTYLGVRFKNDLSRRPVQERKKKPNFVLFKVFKKTPWYFDFKFLLGDRTFKTAAKCSLDIL